MMKFGVERFEDDEHSKKIHAIEPFLDVFRNQTPADFFLTNMVAVPY